MGISTQNANDFKSTKNDKDLIETPKVQDFNSNKKPSKFPVYAKDYKNEYLFIIGIDGCFKYFVDNFENIYDDYLSLNKKFEYIKKFIRKLEYDQVYYNINTTCRLFDKNDVHYGYNFLKKISNFIRETAIDNINQDEDDLIEYVFKIYPGIDEIKEYTSRFICLYGVIGIDEIYEIDSDININYNSDSDSNSSDSDN